MPWSRRKTRKTNTTITRTLLAGSLLFAFVSSSSSNGPMPAAQTPTPAILPAQTQLPPPSSSASGVSAQPSPALSEDEIPAPPPFLVIIDPGHGGDDPGATFGSKLAEKDVTLALARRLRSELHARGISARLLRDADVTLTLQQRAENTNEQHAAVYVALHAGSPGRGVRVYTPALLSPVAPAPTQFLPWDSAQSNSLPRSRELAEKIAGELDKRSLAATRLSTPLRPLNNILAPAVAVELAANPDDIQELMSQKLQLAVAAGIAAAIAELRPQLEKQP